jgi:protein TonB
MKSENARELTRWVVCGVLVLAAHGGAAAVFSTWRESSPPGEAAPAIMVELAPVSAATTTEQTDAPPTPEEEKVEPEPEEEQVEKVEEEPPPEQKVEEPPPPPPPEKVEVALPEPEKPKPPPPKKVAKKETAKASAKRVAPRETASLTGSSDANPNARPSWNAMISAHLHRNKGYPSGARSRREQGTAVLAFVIDRNGRVLSERIVRGSGYPELDQETLAMARRAQPFPPPPPGVAGSQFPFTVPVNYYLR